MKRRKSERRERKWRGKFEEVYRVCVCVCVVVTAGFSVCPELRNMFLKSLDEPIRALRPAHHQID